MYQAGVDEQVIQQFTGHASEVVRKYKKTSEDLLKSANKTVSGNDFALPAKRPVSATVSKAPNDQSSDEPPCKTLSLEHPIRPKSQQVAKPKVCQYFASQNCKGMCKVLHQIDEKLDQKKLKSLKLKVEYQQE